MMQIFSLPRRHLMYWAANLIMPLGKDNLYIYIVNMSLLSSISRPMRSFDATLRAAVEFISNPHKLWESGRLCDRRAVLRLAFPGGFQYHRNTGLRTAETPLPFKVLGELAGKQIQLAEKAGFEPSFHAYKSNSYLSLLTIT
ncbi:hypothetical protein [Nitrosomonas sp.]|uniref:hypothetical protein n=1 Tax=Nitrosomonas sp. TaxID=42353 RepID=UPI0037CCAF6C